MNDEINLLDTLEVYQKTEVLPPDYLADEMARIQNQSIRSFVTRCLEQNELISKSPADNDIDSYPPDEFLPGGLVLHIKRAIQAADINLQTCLVPEEEIDLIYAALILTHITKPIYFESDDPSEAKFDRLNYITAGYILEEVRNSYEKESWAEDITPEILVRIIRLIHCSYGAVCKIMEFIPSDFSEVVVASSNLVAQSLHYIVDGEDISIERWMNV